MNKKIKEDLLLLSKKLYERDKEVQRLW